MQYESEFLKLIHQDAIEMFRIGVITEARMREYDKMCLPNSKNESSSVYSNDNPVSTNQISPATN